MDTNNFTFFFGGPLSQWYHAEFEVDGLTYFTAEQYMMAGKARLFQDEGIFEQIMATRDPREQKQLGRKVRDFDVDTWNHASRNIVYDGNYAKFAQNPGLKEMLLSTRDTTLVEASPTDRLWGIGLPEGHPDTLDRKTWRGVNWLGEVLNKVRNDIQAGTRTTKFEWSADVFEYDQAPPI